MTFTEMARRIDSLNIEQVMGDVLEENKEDVVDLNRSQLLQGRRKDGISMGTYRPFTIEQRQKKGLQTNFVDLYYEGDFQGRMDLLVNNNTFDIISNDSKSHMLQDKYGDEILGLSDDNKRKFMIDKGQDSFVRKVSAITGIKTK